MRAFHPNSGSDRNPDPAQCFSQERLLLYLDGKLAAAEELAVESHVETCDRCSRLLNRQSNPVLRDLPELPEFEIRGVVAFGGMGTIYRAYEHALHREVAIKMMKPSLANDATLRERFVNEARISGQLDHANILPVHALRYLPDGRPWLVMKLVRGKTMADLLAHRQPDHSDANEFLEYFDQICKTVTYAHALGVIHRDLKPSNIMVERVKVGTEEQHTDVFVMDWGLAKELPSARARGRAGAPVPRPAPDAPLPHARPTAQSLTSAGLGTVPYMAPEQARGEPDLDERADVFSLGAILCEILTDEPPYGGTDGQTSAFDQLLDTAARGDLGHAEYLFANCTADRDLIKLATDCLQEDRERRPRNAGEVAKRIIAYRTKLRDNSNLSTLREVSELVEATSRKVESQTRAEVEERVRIEAEERAKAEERAREEQHARARAELRAREEQEARAAADARARRARERAAKSRRRAVIVAVVASVIAVALCILLAVGYWQYREYTTRAIQHELTEAEQTLVEARNSSPDAVLPYLQRAQARVDVAKKLAESVFTSERVRADLAAMDQRCQAEFAAAYFRRGAMFVGRGNWKDAADAFQKAVQYDSGFADAYVQLGGTQFQRKQYRDALGAYIRAFELNPDQTAKTYSTAARTAATVLSVEPAPLADDSGRTELQSLARQWLAEAVARYRQRLADSANNIEETQQIRSDLNQCKNDDPMTLLQSDKELNRFPADDREAWKLLWKDIDELLKLPSD